MVLATACALWLAESYTPAADVDLATMEAIWQEARERGELPPEQPTFRRLWGGGIQRRYW
jgi:hypothetical protein